MHALLFEKFGGPEVLHWGEQPDPVAASGQALVRMCSVGLNFADVYRRNGHYHLSGTAPWILGYEGAGVIEQAAPGDSLFPVGTRVGFADMPHANAELVAVDLDKLMALPDDITFDTAAAIRRERAAALFAQIRGGQLQPNIAARYPLSEGAQAHAHLKSRAAIGKVLLAL